MGLKSRIIKPFAKRISKEIQRNALFALEDQERIFNGLMKRASRTSFGRDHELGGVRTLSDFQQRCPIRDYEALKPYFNAVAEGGANVLWPGKPAYLAKTSGTTSGVKYIPITKESIPNHIHTARNALFNYCVKRKDFSVFDGKMIFLSGSPELADTSGIPTGRLSGIVNHLVPAWLRTNQLPSYQTNCLEDWEEKLERIVDETIDQDMRLISGIPPWVKMFYESLLKRSGLSTVRDLFPNFSIFVYGGVNYEPYRAGLEELTGSRLDSLETYPASEGFIAFQDELEHSGLLLNTNSGIFYEFVPAGRIMDKNPPRLGLGEVETGVNYALILSSNAGLWSYNIGDTVEFVSLDPYRVRVTGRIKHFISAFGEHVIGKEVEQAVLDACSTSGLDVVEFSVAPMIQVPEGELPYHEWFVEFVHPPADISLFSKVIDQSLQRQNIYYRDLIEGSILRPAIVRPVQVHGFRDCMKEMGKLGGQNKVPRLANDRKIAKSLIPFLLHEI